MLYRMNQLTAVVFFCLMGWICIASANGEDRDVTYAAPSPTIKVGGNTVPESLFDDSEDADVVNASEGDGPLPAGQTVSVGSLGQIELHVENQDITKILKLLSLQSQRNIVASRNVAGTISADLYGVDFYEALEAILHANGFGYRQKGNFIYVFTSDELAQMQQYERKLVTSVRRLNYINASDASTFVTPLLSPEGTIAVNGETTPGIQPSIGDVGENSFAYPDTLVIRDYQENVDEIKKVLAELDVRPKQILIQSTILDVKLDENNAFGTDLNILADTDFLRFTDPLAVVDDIISGAVPGYSSQGEAGLIQSTPGNVANGDASIKLGVVSRNVSVFIRALDRVVDMSVIAKPKLTVLNRQKANLLVGAKLGYLSTTATETSTTQTVEFLEVGTQLTVRPHASDDGFIRLEMMPTVSDGSTEQVGSFVVPNETTSELITNVRARSGQTIVLGGLFKEDTQISRDRVPYLSEAPIFGNAFKGHDDSVRRSEVIFLITPTILKDEAMYAAGEAANDSTELAGIGAKKGLLPWSRTRQTAAHMREALTYYEQGNVDRALFFTKMALHLEPNHTEALRLKERITERRMRDVNNSILKNAIDVLIAEQQKISQLPEPAPQPEVVEPQVKPAPQPVPAAAAPQVPAAPQQTTWEQPETVEPAAVAEPQVAEQVAVEVAAPVIDEPQAAESTEGKGTAGLLRAAMQGVLHPGAIESDEPVAEVEMVEAEAPAEMVEAEPAETQSPTVIVIKQSAPAEAEEADDPAREPTIIEASDDVTMNTPAVATKQYAEIEKPQPSPRVISAVSRWLPGPQSRIIVNTDR